MPKFFISYSREDFDFASKLAMDLKALGVDVWMDKFRIPSGDNWVRAIQNGLELCECLLVICSPASMASDTVMNEVLFAYQERKKIIPIIYQECKIFFILMNIQHIDFIKDYNRGKNTLLEALNVDEHIKRREGFDHFKKTISIFLCHASEDKQKVHDVYRRLKQKGFKPWLDKEDLLPGQAWDKEIPKAIKSSDFIMIFFSETSVSKRGYVQKEFNLALNVLNEMPQGKIFVIPIRLDNCSIPEVFKDLQYCNIFEQGGFEKIVRAIHSSLGKLETTKFAIRLRSESYKKLSQKTVEDMLKRMNFFDDVLNEHGNGIQHRYSFIERQGQKVVIDKSTNLIWQQSGSKKFLNYLKAIQYIKELNIQNFAGYNDWRLPTLEEAMSLMESNEKNYTLYIDPLFDAEQHSIWTADKKDVSSVWFVFFNFGYCDVYPMANVTFVRAVRSET